MRVCSNCNKPGHYKPRCPNKLSPAPENNISEQGERKTLKDIGREILEQQNQVFERIPDDFGTIPKTGLWLINLERKRIAGKISQIKKDGTILWSDCYSTLIESDPKMILEAGYKYLELESQHLMFEITAKNWAGK